MKILAILSLFALSFTSFAGNYGKFKVTYNEYYSFSAVFLLNSYGDIKILDNDQYLQIESSPFFGETTITVKSSGDEDHVKATFFMKDNKILKACSAFIDLKNDYIEPHRPKIVQILRWNKSKKAYEDIYNDALVNATNEECLTDLLSAYED